MSIYWISSVEHLYSLHSSLLCDQQLNVVTQLLKIKTNHTGRHWQRWKSNWFSDNPEASQFRPRLHGSRDFSLTCNENWFLFLYEKGKCGGAERRRKNTGVVASFGDNFSLYKFKFPVCSRLIGNKAGRRIEMRKIDDWALEKVSQVKGSACVRKSSFFCFSTQNNSSGENKTILFLLLGR
jgi:hypothetical protein